MLSKENGRIIFHSANCTQCGVCLSICPQKAISSRRGKQIYEILINEKQCVNCGLCVSSCAANLLPHSAPEEKVVNDGKCYLAYSQNEDERYWASSGGACRTMAREALSLKLVDAVYSLSYSAGDAEEISGKWFVAPPDTFDLPQSIYRVILWGEHIGDMPRNVQKVMLIGLPCQLLAANNALKKHNPRIEILNVAILCRKTKTLGFSRYIARSCGNAQTPLRSVRYRGEGWPGEMKVDGTPLHIPFVYHAFCWNLNGCRRCFDSYYINGDITVGDPWDIVKRDAHEKGQSLLYVHSKAGQLFLHKIKILALHPLLDREPKELMGLGISLNKEKEYSAHQGMPFFYRVKKTVGEILLSIIAFLK